MSDSDTQDAPQQPPLHKLVDFGDSSGHGLTAGERRREQSFNFIPEGETDENGNESRDRSKYFDDGDDDFFDAKPMQEETRRFSVYDEDPEVAARRRRDRKLARMNFNAEDLFKQFLNTSLDNIRETNEETKRWKKKLDDDNDNESDGSDAEFEESLNVRKLFLYCKHIPGIREEGQLKPIRRRFSDPDLRDLGYAMHYGRLEDRPTKETRSASIASHVSTPTPAQRSRPDTSRMMSHDMKEKIVAKLLVHMADCHVKPKHRNHVLNLFGHDIERHINKHGYYNPEEVLIYSVLLGYKRQMRWHRKFGRKPLEVDEPGRILKEMLLDSLNDDVRVVIRVMYQNDVPHAYAREIIEMYKQALLSRINARLMDMLTSELNEPDGGTPGAEMSPVPIPAVSVSAIDVGPGSSRSHLHTLRSAGTSQYEDDFEEASFDSLVV
eukprot:GFYU01023223.1.p1 GENE.GFYU01023223.1~~GFYU01023223.1.p1  ORF type:complete len:438 (+),score=90.96 GFYU01023223.1:320-1633(+)